MRRLLLLLLLLPLTIKASDAPLVSTKLGQLRGGWVGPDEHSCAAFKGVPFAEAPVGPLRFAKPIPVKPWKEVREAVAFGPQCVMHTSSFGVKPEAGESEDCLYLDITLPPKHDVKGSPKPVMVWIHGGGFVIGNGGPSYNPEVICRRFGPHDVIVVTIQYRLGLFGFLAHGDEAKGNFGMWDQVEALRWVRANIRAFGGDPGAVTIFGESAGGASVSYLSYAPAAEELFARAIAQSGAAQAYWAGREIAAESSRELMAKTGCEDLDCLRQLSSAELMAAEPRQPFNFILRKPGKKYVGGGYNVLANGKPRWAPRIDGDLFPGTEAAAAKLKPKPFMTGTTSQEGRLFLLSPILDEIDEFDTTAGEPFRVADDSVHEETFLENLDSAAAVFVDDPEKTKIIQAVARMAKFIYLDEQGWDGIDRVFLTARTLDLFSDLWMNLPCLQDAHLRHRHGWTVWLYNYDYEVEGAPRFPTVHSGAGHAEELYLMFENFGVPFNVSLSERDEKVSGNLIKLWTNFAKHGNPSFGEVGSAGLKWPPYQSLEKPTHLIIREKLKVSDAFHKPSIPFWTRMAPEIVKQLSGKTEL